jgi:hypothetical protein
MKAAEVAARRGHRVTLVERRAVTGGQLRIAARIRGRGEIAGVIDHLDEQLSQLDVELRLSTELGAAEILALEPTHVVVATGSAPGRFIVGNRAQGILQTPGLDADHVLSVWDVLEGQQPIGRRVLLVDDGEGSWKSVGLALQLDADEHDVEFVTALPHAAAKLGPFSAQLATKRLFATRVNLRPFATLLELQGPRARLRQQGRECFVEPLDTVVLAGWHMPVTALYFELKAASAAVTRIGDAVASRTMMEAIHEGERTARAV